jgi:hypothetical protein
MTQLQAHASGAKADGWSPSAIVLASAAILLIGTGLYFLFLRPPLLPEDMRYIGSSSQLDAIRPSLETWLTQVFRVMGGYVIATGTLGLTLAATSFREHRSGAALGTLIAGVASIGLMTILNFAIRSDFKWVLLGMALVWAFSLVLFWFEQRGGAPYQEE